MSKQANPTVIGAFVVGAVVLLVVGIMVFSNGKVFGDKLTYVLYFEDNLKGLNVGAPVTFRGTRVGTVSDITVVIDAQGESIRIPVFMDLEEESVEVVNVGPDTIQDGQVIEDRDRAFIQKLIEKRGLRAQLEMQSLVTGQLQVQLDFFPDAPIKLHTGLDDRYPEFPTVPSSLNQLAQKLEDLPLKDLVNSTLGAIQGFERLINSPEVSSFGTEAKSLIADIRRLVKDMDRKLVPLATSLDVTIRDTQNLVQNIDSQIEPMASSIGEVAAEARKTLEDVQKTLSAIEGIAGKDSALGYRLSTTLKELGAAARSVRDLADYLERHPEALLQGKN